MFSAQPVQQTYDCIHNNPCTPENAAANKFYFTHDDPALFVQCSEHGATCYVRPCANETIWNQDNQTCVHDKESGSGDVHDTLVTTGESSASLFFDPVNCHSESNSKVIKLRWPLA